jgi:hypothetical protein
LGGQTPSRRARLTSGVNFVNPMPAHARQQPLPGVGVTLAGLERGQCRYPVGESQPRRLLYCGKPSLPGKSWCSAHQRLWVRS